MWKILSFSQSQCKSVTLALKTQQTHVQHVPEQTSICSSTGRDHNQLMTETKR